jgi:hypothetical protein
MCIFVGGTNSPQRKEGGKLLYYSPKNSHWKLASRNWNIRFWNRNIRFLKYSRYRAIRILRFGNRNIQFFQGLVRGGVYGHWVLLISLGFLGYVSIKTLLAIHVVSLLIERQHILKIKYKNNFFILRLHNIESYHFISLWLHEGCHIDLALALTL